MKKTKKFSAAFWPGIIALISSSSLFVVLAIFLPRLPWIFCICVVLFLTFLFSWMVYSRGYFSYSRISSGCEYRLIKYFEDKQIAHLEELIDEKKVKEDLFFNVVFSKPDLIKENSVYVALKVFGDGGKTKLYLKSPRPEYLG